MRVLNIHERKLSAPASDAGKLIDSLATADDLLWPKQTWPPMKFDRPLSMGVTGGHGPIRYSVEGYTPGTSICFRFLGPKGFDGTHRYELIDAKQGGVVLRHTLQMTTHGRALVSWPLLFRPMHDALIEDSLACAESSLGLTPQVKAW